MSYDHVLTMRVTENLHAIFCCLLYVKGCYTYVIYLEFPWSWKYANNNLKGRHQKKTRRVHSRAWIVTALAPVLVFNFCLSAHCDL